MKWLFIVLVIINLAVFGFSQLETPAVNIKLTTREKNASQVIVVTGQLGERNSNTAVASEPAAEPIASPTPSAAPTPTPTQKPSPTPTPVVTAGVCLRWAGVTGEQIDTARAQIKSLGLQATENSSGESTKVWVYMPPLESIDAAKLKAQQLAEMGVTDYFVVNNGGRWQNAISLGVFSNREAGDRHLEELKALGVKSAVVRDRDDTLKQASFTIKNITPAQEQKLQSLSTQYRGSVIRELRCK